LINNFDFHGLSQVNHIQNHFGRILDLIFVNYDDVSVEKCDDALIKIDILHPALILNFAIKRSHKLAEHNETREILSFRKTKFNELRQYLSDINWNTLINPEQSLDQQIDLFYKILNNGISNFVPKVKINGFKFPIWFSKTLKEKIIFKKTLHKKYKQTYSRYIYDQFIQARRECKLLAHSNYVQYIQKCEKEIKNNPRKIFQYINNKKQKTAVTRNLYLHDEKAKSPKEGANLFAKKFSQVYSNVQLASPLFTAETSLGENLSELIFSNDEVFNKLYSLPKVTSHGPDGIPPILLKECAAELTVPLTLLFNQSLASGCFPKTWKTSYVTPIHKKGDSNNVENFRAICKMSAFPKCLEALIYDRLKPLITPLISQRQHGFMKGKSTLTNLVSTYQYLTECLEGGNQVDCIYTDYRAAYDKVNINMLCTKLRAIGIAGPLLSWFSNYLSCRIQIVRYKNAFSEPINVLSGCPQGGHVSGLLFNIYINDLVPCIQNVNSWLFADDYKMARVIRGPDDRQHLQNALDNVVSWCELNGMELNVAKCQIMTFTRKHYPLVYDYTIGVHKLVRIEQVKDLGIIFDSDLSFNSHVNIITNKAYRNLGFLYRNSREFKSPLTLKSLYSSIIRSSLEYCAVLWSPMYAVHGNAIERIQKKILRMLAFKSNELDNYSSKRTILSHFEMQTLEQRRNNASILFIAKLLKGDINCPEIYSQLQFKENHKVTRDNAIFRLKKYNTNIGENNPINRSMKLCNTISNPPYNINLDEESIPFLKTKLSHLELALSHQ
ncbi:hypothetical protein WDU94_000030, partial [Cyamophila willieti]